jgi:hypothetical protein
MRRFFVVPFLILLFLIALAVPAFGFIHVTIPADTARRLLLTRTVHPVTTRRRALRYQHR